MPGQRLIETELLLRFGVGRNAVREAIHWLAAKGIVEMLQRFGSSRSCPKRAPTLQPESVGQAAFRCHLRS